MIFQVSSLAGIMLRCSAVLFGILTNLCLANEAERRLTNVLMKNYLTNVRPVAYHEMTVVVTLDLAINMIIDLDERNQLLRSNVWLRMHWTDHHLTWNSSAYEGIENIRLPVTSIWRPDITLYNDVSEELPQIDGYLATIHSDGSVAWFAPAVVSSSCPLDVTYFPWDQQVCSMTWGSWSFDGFKVDLLNKSSKWDMSDFLENGEWELIDTPLIRHVEYFQCCIEPYPTLEFQLVIKRKSLYYMANLILPCALCTVCALLVFWLPPECGEKVALSVTILLTVTVFLLMVAEAMPAQSLVIPIITWYFLGIIVILAGSSVMTVIILNYHHRGDLREEVPEWMKLVILKWMASLVGMTKIVETNKVRNKIAMQEISKTADKPAETEPIKPAWGGSKQTSVCDMSNGHPKDPRESNHSPVSMIEAFLMPGVPFGSNKVSPFEQLMKRAEAAKNRCNTSVSENIEEKESLKFFISECFEQCINQLQTIFSRLELFRFRVAETRKTERLISEWMLVGEVLDRFFLAFFLILTIILHVAILLAHP